MKKFLFLFSLILVFACGKIVSQPKVLVEKNTMAELIAELAVDDQLMMADPEYQPSDGARFTLKKYKVNVKDFKESYSYYVATKDMDAILDNAKNIILNKDPKAKDYIQKRLKENESTMPTENQHLEN